MVLLHTYFRYSAINVPQGLLMSTIRRVTLSLPHQLVRDLNYVHRRIGVSRSVFVASLLSEAVHDLRLLLESVPDDPSVDDLVRFRGDSARLAESRVQALLSMSEGASRES